MLEGNMMKMSLDIFSFLKTDNNVYTSYAETENSTNVHYYNNTIPPTEKLNPCDDLIKFFNRSIVLRENTCNIIISKEPLIKNTMPITDNFRTIFVCLIETILCKPGESYMIPHTDEIFMHFHTEVLTDDKLQQITQKIIGLKKEYNVSIDLARIRMSSGHLIYSVKLNGEIENIDEKFKDFVEVLTFLKKYKDVLVENQAYEKMLNTFAKHFMK